MNDLSLLLELFMEKFHTRTEALKWQRLTQPHSNENQEQSRFPTETQTHTRALFLFGGLDAGMLGMLVCLVFFFFLNVCGFKVKLNFLCFVFSVWIFQ